MKIIKTLVVLSLLAAPMPISFNVQAANQSICDPDANVVLYKNGSIQSCQLKNNYAINNINVTCKNGGFIAFYENGELEACMLYEGVTISDTKCKPDAPIYFFSNGNLRSCMKQE